TTSPARRRLTPRTTRPGRLPGDDALDRRRHLVQQTVDVDTQQPAVVLAPPATEHQVGDRGGRCGQYGTDGGRRHHRPDVQPPGVDEHDVALVALAQDAHPVQAEG